MSTKPTHEVFVVIDPVSKAETAKARWTKIGVGFFKNDGMTLLLDAVPFQSRLVVRPIARATDKIGGPQ